jgi:hypothetical protein
MSTSAQPQPTLFLSDEAFDLLVNRIATEVLHEVSAADFEHAIGTRKDRFEFIVKAMGAGGRTQGFIGQETAGYLRNALGAALIALDSVEFQSRTTVEREDAIELLRQLDRFASPEQPVPTPREKDEN